MISKRSKNKPGARTQRSCYVYIQLPQSGNVVTCARYTREILPNGESVGSLVYGRNYRSRKDAVPIDPYELPITDTVATTGLNDGVFGAIQDSSPDGWGQRVIGRLTERTDLDIIDYLLYSPDDRVGALSFGESQIPPDFPVTYPSTLKLSDLLRAAELIEETDPAYVNSFSQSESLAEQSEAERLIRIHNALVAASSGIGGARPKHVVEDGDRLWVAKFPSISDRWNNAPVEAAMFSLAERAGIVVPKTRIVKVGNRSVLLVERFDRARDLHAKTGNRKYFRHRMVSALTVLRAEAAMTARARWSYLLLSDELQRWSSQPRQDRQELYRRMVFNALISNLDDHPRNHALIAPDIQFHLAPVYDIVPQPVLSESRDLALECGLNGRRATRENLLSGSLRFDVAREDANHLINQMKSLIAAEWENEIRSQGGSIKDCHIVQRAFVPDGFEFDS